MAKKNKPDQPPQSNIVPLRPKASSPSPQQEQTIQEPQDKHDKTVSMDGTLELLRAGETTLATVAMVQLLELSNQRAEVLCRTILSRLKSEAGFAEEFERFQAALSTQSPNDILESMHKVFGVQGPEAIQWLHKMGKY